MPLLKLGHSNFPLSYLHFHIIHIWIRKQSVTSRKELKPSRLYLIIIEKICAIPSIFETTSNRDVTI